MRVSIITVCYNRSATIAETIDSVIGQDYSNFEFIIIDGNSTDGTKEIIESYGRRIDTYISENDSGMYEAINKGLALATGDIIGLMHSDDTFYDNAVLTKIANTFQKYTAIHAVYGDGIYVSNDVQNQIVRKRVGGEFSVDKIKKGWLPLHPTVYIRKDVIKKYGPYSLDFQIASDTEFLLRYLYKYNIRVQYVNSYFVRMRVGGFSTSPNRALEVLIEDYKIYKLHGLSAITAVFLKKVQTAIQYVCTKVINHDL